MDIDSIREIFEGNTTAHICMSDPFDKNTSRTVHQRVSDAKLQEHLKGKVRIGFLPFADGTDRCKYAGWDVDTGEVDHLRAICDVLERIEIPYYVETSKSRGWHIWLFCDLIPAEKLRRLGLWVIREAQMEGIIREFFPKQNDPKKTGNAIWLPFFSIEVPE